MLLFWKETDVEIIDRSKVMLSQKNLRIHDHVMQTIAAVMTRGMKIWKLIWI